MDKKGRLPQKQTMNLYYKPDRTTKPATIALYTLFVFVCLLGLAKVFVYDLWYETDQARQQLAAQEAHVEMYTAKLSKFKEIQEMYWRYSTTDEERESIDRLEVLAMLDETVGSTAAIHSIVINGDTVQLQFSGVTLKQTADIADKLESSPIVARATIDTAATTGYTPRDGSNSLVQANAVIRLQKEVAE